MLWTTRQKDKLYNFIKVFNQTIKYVDNHKILGVNNDNNLKSVHHINVMSKTLAKNKTKTTNPPLQNNKTIRKPSHRKLFFKPSYSRPSTMFQHCMIRQVQMLWSSLLNPSIVKSDYTRLRTLPLPNRLTFNTF